MSVSTPPPSRATREGHPVPPRRPLRERARLATPRELDAIPWLPSLTPSEREQIVARLQVAEVEAGEHICRVGRAASHWFGVIDGLLKLSEAQASARTLGFNGVASGGWWGESTLLRRETYRHDIQALRHSVVAGLPLEAFEDLLATSIAFNRYLLRQLNERMEQLLAAREMERRNDPDLRVARHLAALFHPQLCPGVAGLLRITQQELGLLVGLSRQRVNEALGRLEADRLIAVAYGGVRVLELERLRQYPEVLPPSG
jgi:CRP/FNR family transcriptional regulator, cyclic AMP receptor protein